MVKYRESKGAASSFLKLERASENSEQEDSVSDEPTLVSNS